MIDDHHEQDYWKRKWNGLTQKQLFYERVKIWKWLQSSSCGIRTKRVDRRQKLPSAYSETSASFQTFTPFSHVPKQN